MKDETELLKTSIELRREFGSNNQQYFKLMIGTDPETRVVITDRNMETLLNDLPKFLSTVISSQVLIETHQTRRNGHSESASI